MMNDLPRRRACTKIQSGLCLYFTCVKLSFSKRPRGDCFLPWYFYRGGAEQKIRQYLVDNNYVDAVIALAPNLFWHQYCGEYFGAFQTQTQFIDASGLFKSATNNHILEEEHIEQILKLFADKEDVPHLAKSISFEEIAQNDYNLAVSSYVEQKDTREVINIDELNAQIRETVTNIDHLRAEIDKIVAEIEG